MGCDDGSLRLLDAATGAVIRNLGNVSRFTSAADFSPDNRLLAGPGDRESILLWDVKTGQEKAKFIGPYRSPRTLAFAPDGKTLATAHDGPPSFSQEGTILLWDVESRSIRRTMPGPKGMIFALAYSPDGKLPVRLGGMEGEHVMLMDASLPATKFAFSRTERDGLTASRFLAMAAS